MAGMFSTDRNSPTGATMACPKCGSVMASRQTIEGPFFICGHCKLEIPVCIVQKQPREMEDAER